MSNRDKQVYKARVERHKEKMPWYIIEYIEEKTNLSPATLYGYLIEYEMFLHWLISSRLVFVNGEVVTVTKLHEVPIETLEHLPLKQVKRFKSYLERQGNKTKAIIRTFSALKSLFNYLTKNTEDDNGECYFYRNVMAKMEIHKEKIDASARAKEISEVIFQNNDDIKFMRFLSNEYEQMLKENAPGKLRFFKRDRERDIAILSLILGTGLRVSETASLTISSINFRTRYIKIVRKGDKKSSILATQTALDDVQEYLKVRAARYKCPDAEDILFVTNYKGSYAQISVNAIQKLTEKYTRAFDEKKSPHKLRHTYATNHYNENKDLVLLANQMGHNSMETTSLYTNIDDTKRRAAIERLEQRQFEDTKEK
ncbi:MULTISPECIES: tyrosine recombinase XerS [Bacillus cereus group]|nr:MULTISPECIES: tyrosine recombinase XerS [Bacillus cereus group]QUW68439.1 tyrosine recombinase XerS [Pseudomonas synxantha]EXY05449.1 recombinase XerS [Bacillus thuringiensis]MEB8632550.1 tyrosine recombinase XerS [Bacillus cereus]MEB8744912.1 tyrosine recombinase XerS [Bacillus cereus]MEB8798195.1 tyrosine recombinase XerS [Bacillus cereus]